MDEAFLDTILWYAPQSLFLIISTDSPETVASLCDVLRRSCHASTHVALRLALLLQSVMSLHEGDTRTCQLFEGLLTEIQSGVSASFFQHQRIFLTSIVNISKSLVSVQDRTLRGVDLVHMLESMNPFFSHDLCYIPTGSNKDPFRRVIRFASQDCVVFNTRERAPYMLVVEVQVMNQVKCGQFGKSTEVQAIPSPPMSPSKALRRVVATSDPQQQAQNVTKSPLAQMYGLTWEENKARLQALSPLGDLPGWDADCYVVKHGDNLVQEALAMQLIGTISSIWLEAHLPLKLTPYHIIVVSHEAGLIECVMDAKTIDSIKKAAGTEHATLSSHFLRVYGDLQSPAYRAAQRNFIESCAGYSVLCYLLQIRDRHNGNILLKRDGTVVHIDFGFMITTSPGGWNFENVPFKLPMEYVEVMGIDGFAYFKLLVFMGLQHLRRHSERISSLVEMADVRCVPCLGADTRSATQSLKERFLLSMTESEFMRRVKDMIDLSLDNWRTRSYDKFQRMQNGIEH
jgi:phosphatidylinositol 4-kinase